VLPALKTAMIICPEEVVAYTPEAIKRPLREMIPQKVQELFFKLVL